MSDLVFIAFPNEQKAEEVPEKLLALQKDSARRWGLRRALLVAR